MAWQELFSTDMGILSLITIFVVFVIAGYILRYASRMMERDAQNAAAAQKAAKTTQ
jgi:hypothetical protein